jgi:hypothetical protein
MDAAGEGLVLRRGGAREERVMDTSNLNGGAVAPDRPAEVVGARASGTPRRPNQPDPWAELAPARRGVNPTALALAGVATLIAGIGLARGMMPKERSSVVAARSSSMSERARTMGDAVGMAKDAQAMQRERMDAMRGQIGMSYETGDMSVDAGDGERAGVEESWSPIDER